MEFINHTRNARPAWRRPPVPPKQREPVGSEIKAGRSLRPADLKGLSSLAEVVGRYKPFERIVAWTGTGRELHDPKVRVLPWLEVLRELARRR